MSTSEALLSGATLMSNPEGWREAGELGVALALSALVGVEREFRHKSAGLRTHSLVGLGSALFMLISKYGFYDVLAPGRVLLDPSRVAAQIVSGIGFLGAGIIFVRRDSVRGLTTAAAVWVTAAIGAAAGAGLPVLAALTTLAYFVVAVVFTPLVHHLPRSSSLIYRLRVQYADGRGVLRQVLGIVTRHGFVIDEVATESTARSAGLPQPVSIEVSMQLHGRGSLLELADALSTTEGVIAVAASDDNGESDTTLGHRSERVLLQNRN